MDAYKVSVYMDDIVISSNSDADLSNVLLEIKPLAEKAGFPLNEAKEEGPAEKITAFNIELSNGVLTLTEERLQDFIAAYRESDNFNVISGIVGYVTTVNTGQAAKIV
ncbi:putative reverse transcriptase [Marinobacter algicola DG893]|uniref:Putative reverse transcriptase n=2 Tax=Marinobacter algicola TaxID=236100 RepID=A6EY14_9GAMM|nr:putative reverse transcriptase [Marinobacter algicola DG893]